MKISTIILKEKKLKIKRITKSNRTRSSACQKKTERSGRGLTRTVLADKYDIGTSRGRGTQSPTRRPGSPEEVHACRVEHPIHQMLRGTQRSPRCTPPTARRRTPTKSSGSPTSRRARRPLSGGGRTARPSRRTRAQRRRRRRTRATPPSRESRRSGTRRGVFHQLR